MLIVM